MAVMYYADVIHTIRTADSAWFIALALGAFGFTMAYVYILWTGADKLQDWQKNAPWTVYSATLSGLLTLGALTGILYQPLSVLSPLAVLVLLFAGLSLASLFPTAASPPPPSVFKKSK